MAGRHRVDSVDIGGMSMNEELKVKILEAASNKRYNWKHWDPVVEEGYTQEEVLDAVDELRRSGELLPAKKENVLQEGSVMLDERWWVRGLSDAGRSYLDKKADEYSQFYK